MRISPTRVVGPAALMVSALGFLLSNPCVVSAHPYRLNAKAKNRVEFHSKATLESFSGKAKGITVGFDIDPANLKTTNGTVTVDLRTLDTGIELRNKHMRENHLHTDSFPNAVFVFDSVQGANALPASGSANLTMHGTMTIHGTSRTIAAPVTINPSADATTIRLQSEFPLKITDFGIPRPEFLFLKLAEEVKIVVDLTLERATE